MIVVDRTPMAHPLNFEVGWWFILAAFVTGAVIGLGFHREDYLGGYGSFRRRMVRLGHIALAALGGLNVLYGVSPLPATNGIIGSAPGALFVAGAIAMPSVCFLSAWRKPCRHLFFVPVSLLMGGVICILFAISR
jgi:hypothetical protein